MIPSIANCYSKTNTQLRPTSIQAYFAHLSVLRLKCIKIEVIFPKKKRYNKKKTLIFVKLVYFLPNTLIRQNFPLFKYLYNFYFYIV